METKGASYKIIGVVENVMTSMELFFTCMWAPITAINNQMERSPVDLDDNKLAYEHGEDFKAIILAKNKKDLTKIKNEYSNIVARINASDVNPNFISVLPEISTANEWLKQEQSGFINIVILFLVLFILLPIINLQCEMDNYYSHNY